MIPAACFNTATIRFFSVTEAMRVGKPRRICSLNEGVAATDSFQWSV